MKSIILMQKYRHIIESYACILVYILVCLYDFSSSFVNGNIFFLFSELITFVACSLKQIQNAFVRSFLQCKIPLFSMLSKNHIGDIEWPQGICSPIFVAEELSGLWVH